MIDWSPLFGTVARAATTHLDILDKINQAIVDPLIKLIFFLAFLYFLWGVVQFIMNAQSDTGRETGKQHIFWGIIGMFIMVSAFALVRLVCGTIGGSC